ncbi:MAG: peptide-methionine (R)-S-oxide reductase MsrB [Oscillibacter sp.]|jgi:peptide methionine sulfoxide reductase msrA/msrB|nr:peptide-methionine (R)-S-oxide reductase MsrB [Oscillibacter sp.]
MKKRILALGVLALCAALLWGCAAGTPAGRKAQVQKDEAAGHAAGEKQGADQMTMQGFDGTYRKKEGTEVIYLAGGCFWGMEKLAQALPGVLDAVSGYANGDSGTQQPTYELVCTGGTGFKETVRVVYDPAVITLPQLLQAYFLVINPTAVNRQGHDVGTQYQAGIYYRDEASGETVERIAAAEAKKYEKFAVEHGPLVNFYDAEEYHQDYLEKNPGGYCHIPAHKIEDVAALILAEQSYRKPAQEQLRQSLTPQQYNVTQKAYTERAFTGKYWDTDQEGIYVDVTTGQPLFRSADKYESGCGWPSFTAPIYEGVVRYIADDSMGMSRTEVKSSVGDAHLGHIFTDDPESPNGTRYCINSASLRFIPRSEMKKRGYGAYLMLLDR